MAAMIPEKKKPVSFDWFFPAGCLFTLRISQLNQQPERAGNHCQR